MRSAVVLAVAVVVFTARGAAQDVLAAPTRVTVPLAGDRAKSGLFAERIKFAPGDRGRPHTHSTDLHVTVLRGRIFLNWGTRFDTAGARAMTAGDFVVLPAGKAHFEWTDEETEIHVEGVGPVTTRLAAAP